MGGGSHQTRTSDNNDSSNVPLETFLKSRFHQLVTTVSTDKTGRTSLMPGYGEKPGRIRRDGMAA